VAADGSGEGVGPSEDPFGGNGYVGDVVLYDNVLIGDDDPCLIGVDFEDDREVLTFVFTCDPVGRGYEPGTIVVGTANGGYLRRIVSVQVDGQNLIAWTDFASLDEVILEGGFSADLDLNDEGRGNLIDLSGMTIYHGDVGPAELNIALERGALDINPALRIDGDWSWDGLKSFDMDLGIDLLADIKATITSTDDVRIGKAIDVWEHNYPFTFAIGPVPVVGLVEMTVTAGARVSLGGKAAITVGVYADLKAHNRKKFTQSGGWVDDDYSDSNFNVLDPVLDVENKAKANVYVQLDTFVKMYGVAGPQFRNRLFTGVKGSLACEGINFDLEVGYLGRGSIRLNLFNRFTPEKIFLKVTFEFDVISGQMPYPGHVSPVPCVDESIMCGETIEGDTREVDDPWLSGYTCNVGSYAAPEKVYMWKATKSGPATWELIDPEPNVTNHDVFVVKGLFNLMTGDCEEWGLNEVEFEAEKGETYYLIVDGYDTDEGTFSARLTCDEAEATFVGSDDPDDTINPF
jgi:hypothetical protein